MDGHADSVLGIVWRIRLEWFSGIFICSFPSAGSYDGLLALTQDVLAHFSASSLHFQVGSRNRTSIFCILFILVIYFILEFLRLPYVLLHSLIVFVKVCNSIDVFTSYRS